MLNDRPYRIVIYITRGTNSGRALDLMAKGLQIVAATLPEAQELVDRYVDAAYAVLANVNEGIVMGLVTVLNENTGQVESHHVLTGLRQREQVSEKVQ